MKSSALILWALLHAAFPSQAANRLEAGKTAAPAVPVAPAAPVQKLLPAESSIRFISRQMGVPVEGRFRRFTATSQFDPKRPQASSVSIDIDMQSVDIGSTDTENELKKPGWFDSMRRPGASFRSSRVRALGGGRFEVEGVLAIKGVEQSVMVPVQLTQKGATTYALGSIQIKRMDFRIGEGEWNDITIVANEVTVHFQLALNGIAAL